MAIDPHQKALWIREFRLNGFIILTDFLPRDLIEEMHEQILPLVTGEYARAREGESRSLRGPGRIAFDLRRYTDLMGGPLADERFRRNAVIEELVEAIFALSCPEAQDWRRGRTQVECVFSGSAPMSWHSDQTIEETPDPDGPNRTVRITYNIPLVDFTSSNGAMEMIPGSHHLPRSVLAESFLDVPNIRAWPLRLERGDALLRDGNCLHRGTPNSTERPRPMLDQTYKVIPEKDADRGSG